MRWSSGSACTWIERSSRGGVCGSGVVYPCEVVAGGDAVEQER